MSSIDMRNVIHIESPTNWDSNYRELEWVRSNHNIPTDGQAVFRTSYQFARGRMYILTTAVPGDASRDNTGTFFGSVYGSWGSSANSITGVVVRNNEDTGDKQVEAGIDLEGNGSNFNNVNGFWPIGAFNTTSFPNDTKRAVWLKMPSSGSCTFGVNTPVADGFTPVLPSDTIAYHSGPQGNICIGGLQWSDGHKAEVKRLKIYRFRIFSGDENGTLLSDLVPAQRKTDDVIGLYDILNNNFFPTNQQGENDVGPTYIENPLWSPGVSYRKSVVKIETYKNGNLIQLWPCYSAGPTNPNPPVLTDAYDYDDTITWTVGTGVENSDEYYYYPITATGQANGIQIAVADNPNGWNQDGKPTSSTTYTWKVTAERAGYYQMIMSAMMSSAQHATQGHWSYANIQVNNSSSGVQKLTDYGQTPDFTSTEYNDVVVAIVPLTGYEDEVSFSQSSYRIIVDPTSNIIFREIDGTSLTGYLNLDTSNVTTTFNVGDTFSYSGLVVTEPRVNGTSVTITNYTVSSPDMTTAGTKTVTVTAGTMTATYDIVVNAVLSWVTTATLTNTDSQTFEQGTYNGTIDGVRIPIVNYSSGGYSGGRVSSTSTEEVYKITPPSAGDYMLILRFRRGSGDPQFYVNDVSIGAISGVASDDYGYYEITYPVTLTAGENTLTFKNNSYRCYFDMDDYVWLLKTSTNPMS